MPSVVKIDPSRKIVLSTFHGEITGEDLLLHRQAIASDTAFSPDYVDLVDFSGVRLRTVDPSALGELASQGSLFNSRTVDPSALGELASQGSLFSPDAIHIIVVPDEDAYQLALSYKEMSARTRVNLYAVRSMSEAREVLCGLGFVF